MALTSTVFSPYEIREMAVAINGTEPLTYRHADCVGTLEEELEVITVTKSCRGMVVKSRTRGAGSGTLTLSVHMPWDVYTELFAMVDEKLVEGVVAYGQGTLHPVFTMVLHVFDEDGVEGFRAYPCCTMSTGPARSTENGAEEVAELEMEIAVSPDENGFVVYDALAKDLGTDTNQLKTKWMTAWKPSLMLAAEA